MNKEIGLPALNTLGFGEDELSNIVHEATRDICWSLLPKKIDEAETLELLKKEYSV